MARLVVVDLDQTFTTMDLALDPAALDAAARLRQAGLRLVLVTGRPLRLLPEAALLASTFDAFVLEAGAIWGRGGAWRLTFRGPSSVRRLAVALRKDGLLLHAGRASCSIKREHLAAAMAMPLANSCAFQLNGDHIDIVPRGVDKARGVAKLMDIWGYDRLQVVAVCDGENDTSLRRIAGRLFAVGNAVPAIRATADDVTPGLASAGFVQAADRILHDAGLGPLRAPPLVEETAVEHEGVA